MTHQQCSYNSHHRRQCWPVNENAVAVWMQVFGCAFGLNDVQDGRFDFEVGMVSAVDCVGPELTHCVMAWKIGGASCLVDIDSDPGAGRVAERQKHIYSTAS